MNLNYTKEQIQELYDERRNIIQPDKSMFDKLEDLLTLHSKIENQAKEIERLILERDDYRSLWLGLEN